MEEADESQLWLELLAEAHPPIKDKLYKEALAESGELTAIFSVSPNRQGQPREEKRGEKKKARGESRALDFQTPKSPDFQITR